MFINTQSSPTTPQGRCCYYRYFTDEENGGMKRTGHLLLSGRAKSLNWGHSTVYQGWGWRGKLHNRRRSSEQAGNTYPLRDSWVLKGLYVRKVGRWEFGGSCQHFHQSPLPPQWMLSSFPISLGLGQQFSTWCDSVRAAKGTSGCVWRHFVSCCKL